MKTPNQIAAEVLTTLRNKRPLILNLTNNVVQSITANMLLAVGGVPVKKYVIYCTFAPMACW